MMDWRVLLVVLCLIEGCALQTTTSAASESPTANTNTGSPVSGSLPTAVSGSQPTPPVSGSPATPVSGSQPTPPVSGSPATPVSGSQPTPLVSGSPPTPVSGSQPTPLVSGSQPTHPVSGSQPTPPVSGSQPTPPVSGSQPTPPVSGSQPTPPVSGSQPTPVSGSQPAPVSGSQPAPVSGSQPAPVSGSQPAPVSGSQPAPSVSGSQPAPSVSGSQPAPSVSGSQPAPSVSGSQSTPSGNGITTAAAAASTPYFNLSFSSPETYTTDLQNSASPAFINRAQKIRDALEPMFRSKFRFFLRLIILAFRSGSIVTDTQVVFDTNANATNLPSSGDVGTVVREAASNSSLGLNITADSVNVSAAVIPSQASSNATSASATTMATANATTANATTANTTTATASTTTTAAPTAKSFNLTFSINQTFDPKLSQSSSAEFIALSANITAQLEPFFKKLLKNFLRMIIWRFRSGSIVTDSTLNFSSTNINASDVTTAIRTAIVNGNLSFVIDPNSITVTVNSGNAMASGMAGALLLLSMSLLSLLLSGALHF